MGRWRKNLNPQPMFLLLVVCGAIYLVLGDIHEVCLLLSFVFVVIGITFYQERKTERALEALRDREGLKMFNKKLEKPFYQRKISGLDRADFFIL